MIELALSDTPRKPEVHKLVGRQATMSSFQYGIRDALWAITLLAVALGWWLDHERLQARESRVRKWLCYMMGTEDKHLEPLFAPPTPGEASRRRLQKDFLPPESLQQLSDGHAVRK